MFISKIIRTITFFAVMLPAFVLPSSNDCCNRKESSKKSWTLRSIALPVAGAAVGALAVWGLSQRNTTRMPIEISASLYLKGSFAGFSFGFSLDKISYSSEPKSSSAAAKSHAASSERPIPKKPKELEKYSDEECFFSSKWNRWVLFKTSKNQIT